jgi:hypothetical protein
MTVKELIEVLEKVENKNLKVVVKGTDPTDYVYVNRIDEDDIDVENICIPTEDSYIIRRRLVINGGMF